MARKNVRTAESGSEPTQSSSTLGEPRQRQLSRSPHPYHRRATGLCDEHVYEARVTQSDNQVDGPLISISSGESGTEADDERGRLLKVLPPPRLKTHKGLRTESVEDVTPVHTPLDTPPWLENSEDQSYISGRKSGSSPAGSKHRNVKEKYTKRKRLELAQRTTEIVLFFAVCLIVAIGRLKTGLMLQLLRPGEVEHT
jgi:hypothetical protein